MIHNQEHMLHDQTVLLAFIVFGILGGVGGLGLIKAGFTDQPSTRGECLGLLVWAYMSGGVLAASIVHIGLILKG